MTAVFDSHETDGLRRGVKRFPMSKLHLAEKRVLDHSGARTQDVAGNHGRAVIKSGTTCSIVLFLFDFAGCVAPVFAIAGFCRRSCQTDPVPAPLTAIQVWVISLCWSGRSQPAAQVRARPDRASACTRGPLPSSGRW